MSLNHFSRAPAQMIFIQALFCEHPELQIITGITKQNACEDSQSSNIPLSFR